MSVGSALAALVEQTRRAQGLSYQAVATRARLSKSSVHKIANGAIKTVPDEATMRRLADALGIPYQEILEAAQENLGGKAFDLTESKRRSLYAGAADLTDAQLDALLALIATMRTPRDETP